MTIGIGEVSAVAAPKCLSRWLHDPRTGLLGLRHHGVDFLLAASVVAYGELGRAARRFRDSGVVSEIVSRPDRELETMLQIEEGDGAMLELAPDDAFGWKPEVSVERERAFQVVDPYGEYRDPWLHVSRSWNSAGSTWPEVRAEARFPVRASAREHFENPSHGAGMRCAPAVVVAL